MYSRTDFLSSSPFTSPNALYSLASAARNSERPYPASTASSRCWCHSDDSTPIFWRVGITSAVSRTYAANSRLCLIGTLPQMSSSVSRGSISGCESPSGLL